jgi:hypothetical protein
MSFHIFRVSLQSSRVSFLGSRVSLHVSRMGLFEPPHLECEPAEDQSELTQL